MDALLTLVHDPWNGDVALLTSAIVLSAIAVCYWQRFDRRILLILTVLLYARYLAWRGFETLPTNGGAHLVFGWVVYMAEFYAFIQVLLFVHHVWNPLERRSPPLSRHPTVDVYVTVVNEPLHILRRTLIGCLQQDYAQDRFQVYVLDDGNREEIRTLAARLGCRYLRRPDRAHAKAGNLNHALQKTSGELIAIFDVDHVPTRTFLKETVGFFDDDRVAFVQTPHHFYNPDIFQKNLRLERSLANEQTLFYRVLQGGRDRHNSAFFAGSCGLFRRIPLQEIGGFRTETVTEDIHTSMALHARGYRSCYLNKVLAVGLSPESFDSFIKQRIRWAMGHIQILFRTNPLLVRGLSIPQRIGYLASIWYFLHGVPRLIALVAPLFALLLGLIPLNADVWKFAHYFGAYYVATLIMLKVVGQGTRNAFWSDVYETAGCVAMSWALVKTVLQPWKRRAFVITPKGHHQANRGIAKFTYVLPHLALFGLLIAGVTTGLQAWVTGLSIPGLGISLLWALTNLTLVGVALCSAAEWPEWRKAHRVPARIPVTVITPHTEIEGLVLDLSEEGAKVQIPQSMVDLPADVLVALTNLDGDRITVSAQIRRREQVNEGAVTMGLAFTQVDEKSADAILGVLAGDAAFWSQPQTDRGIWGSLWALVSVFGKVWARSRRSQRRNDRVTVSKVCHLVFDGHRLDGVVHDISRGGCLVKTMAPLEHLAEQGILEMGPVAVHVRKIWAMDCNGIILAGFRIEPLAEIPKGRITDPSALPESIPSSPSWSRAAGPLPSVQSVRLLSAMLLLMSFVPGAVNAGDVFTGYQIDHRGQYYSYLGVRTPLTRSDSSVQPFFQVLGAGLGYTFKDNGVKRDADVQFASPSIGIKYKKGAWDYIAFAGPQFRWKQEDRLSGGRTSEHDVGLYAQGEVFYWHEHGTFHAIASYTNLDDFVWSRIRATRLVHQDDGPCCSVYLGWDIAAMGNKDFYAAQTGPLVQVPIERFYVTVKGGYQYTNTFQNGAYGGIELYFPF